MANNLDPDNFAQLPPTAVLALLQQAARIIALEDKIKQLEHLSITDSLTGLLNRRGFEQAFAAEQDRLRRQGSRGGLLVMIDLDRFKSINDTLGHEVGDKCLQLVAKHLLSSVRDMDSVARMGGDEFAVLLTNTFPDAALSHVQHMALSLNKLSLSWQGQNVFIGASVGVRPIGIRETLADILMHADADMYMNKRANAKKPHRLFEAIGLPPTGQNMALTTTMT